VGAVPRYLAWRKNAHKARPRRSPGYPRLQRSRLNSRRFGGTTSGRACVNRSRGGRERWPRRHLLVVNTRVRHRPAANRRNSRQADRVGAARPAKWRTSISVNVVIVLAEPWPSWTISATAHRGSDYPGYRGPDRPRRLRPSRAMGMITLCECKVYVGFRYYCVGPACPRHYPAPARHPRGGPR
jgi:hypothetical protein